jgi:hypothetical protein
MKFAAVLLFAALLSVQCVASCRSIDQKTSAESGAGGESLPPCHQHHNVPDPETSTPCCNESMLSGTDERTVDLGYVFTTSMASVVITGPQTPIIEIHPQFPAPSPHRDLSPSGVLRI